jgi:hypothetical protein
MGMEGAARKRARFRARSGVRYLGPAECIDADTPAPRETRSGDGGAAGLRRAVFRSGPARVLLVTSAAATWLLLPSARASTLRVRCANARDTVRPRTQRSNGSCYSSDTVSSTFGRSVRARCVFVAVPGWTKTMPHGREF